MVKLISLRLGAQKWENESGILAFKFHLTKTLTFQA